MEQQGPSGWADVAALRVRVATPEDARELVSWTWTGPELADGQTPQSVEPVLDRENAYYSFVNPADEVVAFCCFGAHARRPGGDYSASGIDLCAGVHPSLAASGQTSRFLAAIVVFARALFRPIGLRVTVGAGNAAALNAYAAAGFRPRDRFVAEDAREYLVLTLDQ